VGERLRHAAPLLSAVTAARLNLCPRDRARSVRGLLAGSSNDSSLVRPERDERSSLNSRSITCARDKYLCVAKRVLYFGYLPKRLHKRTAEFTFTEIPISLSVFGQGRAKGIGLMKSVVEIGNYRSLIATKRIPRTNSKRDFSSERIKIVESRLIESPVFQYHETLRTKDSGIYQKRWIV